MTLLYLKHRNFWDKFSGIMYDKWRQNDPWKIKIPEIINRFFGFNDIFSVLDAGCGQGIYYDVLADFRNKRYVGLDFSRGMLEFCRDKHSNIVLVNGNITEISFSDKFFDVVICFNTLMYIDKDTSRAINELLRVVRKLLLIVVPLAEKEVVTDDCIVFKKAEFLSLFDSVIVEDLQYYQNYLLQVVK